MRALAIALRTLIREWKSGELGVLVLAITVAVAALTGVGFLVDRIRQAVDNQAGEVLAADLRLESGAPDRRQGHRRSARRRGIRIARSTGMFSVVFNGDVSQLTAVRAVSREISAARQGHALERSPSASRRRRSAIPAAARSGRIRVWRRRSARASAPSFRSARSKFRVARIMISRPDQGATFVDLAPSLLMNEEDIDATQLIQPGSRLTRALLFAGAAQRYRFL